MALLNFTGFESGDTAEASTSGGTFVIDNTVKRTGGYSFKSRPTTTATGWIEIAKPDRTSFNVATIYTAFWFRAETLPASGSEEILLLNNTASGSKARVRIDNAGILSVYNSGNTLVATGTTALSANVWYLIEFTCGTGGTTAYTLRINGVTELSGTGSFNATNHGFIRYGKAVNRNGNSVIFYYDDIVIDDAAFPTAKLEVKLMPVDSDGSSVLWTIGAGAGSDYQVVDDLPHNSDTDYLLSTLTVNDASLVGFSSTTTSGINGVISAMKALAAAKRDGATDGSYKIRVRSNSTNSDSAAITSTSAYLGTCALHINDPGSGGAWSLARLDAVEAGVIENSGANRTRVSAIQAHVLFVPTQTITPNGIGSTEALGSPAVVQIVAPSGIASAAALGSPAVVQIVAPSGIASTEALGSPVIAQTITPAGIASTLVMGAMRIGATINVFLGSGTIQSAPIVAASSSSSPALPAFSYTFGGPYANGYGTLALSYSILAFWRDLIWILRMFPAVGARRLHALPPECGYVSNPLLLLDYGNIDTDIVDPLVFFSTYDFDVYLDLGGVPGGSASGVVLADPITDPPVPPPNPPVPDPLPAAISPFTLVRRGHRRLDLFLSSEEEQSTVQAVFGFTVTDGYDDPYFVLTVLGQRAVAVQFQEDWERGNRPAISFISKTDVFESDYVIEQRTNTLQPVDDGLGIRGECAHTITVTFKCDGRERANVVWHRLMRAKHRRVAVPWYPEPLTAALNLYGLSTFAPVGFPLSALIWNGYGDGAEVIRLHRRNRDVFETRKVTYNIGLNTLTANTPWLLDIPAHEQVLYVVRYCTIAALDRDNDSDTHQTIKAVFASAD